MSIAKKCDRCRKFYDPYNIKCDRNNINGLILLNIDNEQKYCSHGPYDLCPECLNDLVNWLNSYDRFKEDATNEI